MKVVLGIDLGTTNFKFALYDPGGDLRALHRQPVITQGTHGRCELDTDGFIRLIRNGIAQTCSRAGVKPADISALSYASQANSFLLLEHQHRPLTPLILWPDARAPHLGRTVEQLWARQDFKDQTGLDVCSPLFCVNKLVWLQKNEPRIWKQTHLIMTLSDYFTYLLTGERLGDSSTASLLGLYQVAEGKWWKTGCDQTGIDAHTLSTPVRPGTHVGETRVNPFDLPKRIKVAAGGLDHLIAAIGAALHISLEMSESTGTVLAALRFREHYQPLPGTHTGPGLMDMPFYTLAFRDIGASIL